MNNTQAILEQVQQAKAEAAELLKEVTCRSEENLKLLNKCEALVRHALVKPSTRSGSLEDQAEALAVDSEELAAAVRNRSCHDIALGIMQLAMECKDVLHIHMDYSPHVDELSLYVRPVTTRYLDGEVKDRLFKRSFYFQRDGIKDLLAIEDKLIELVAEARDQAEVQA
ncbi:hypothetical protein [Photobacterium sp. Hal280]|uniref:hypothetical protein n=1 Tax=Photobacterium sp. Hal280 TaxID=3035163 RepID=UPI00301BC04F